MSLENRLLLSAYTVLNTNDSGTGSLRDAVNQANADGNADTITFDATVFATAKTITLTTGAINLNDNGGISIVAPAVGVSISGGNRTRIFNVESGTTANLTGVTITGGHNQIGGGIYLEFKATANLSNCIVSGNSADKFGGGIYCLFASHLTLIDSTVSSNTSFDGGGLFASGTSTISISNSTVNANSSFQGGGIETSGTLTMTNVTVSGNSASGDAGGLELDIGAVVTLTNVTVSGNSSGDPSTLASAGGISNRANLTLNNSIVAGNTNASGASDIPTGFPLTPVSGSNNLIGTGGSGGLMDGNNGNQVGVVNPGLGSLANNGGPTQTVALLPGSPAIHAGMDGTGVPMTDQRGVPRVGGVDIGAYQVAFSGPLVVNTTDGGNLNVPGKLTLFEAVTLANYQPGADTITFDPTVFATPQTITLTAGQLELTDSAATTITAPMAGVTISGNNTSRVFQVDGGATADLNGLTITGGYSDGYGGGVFVTSGNATANLTNCTVTGNTAAQGGGVCVDRSSQVTLIDSTLSGNTGGGIRGYTASLTLSSSTIRGNTATQGAGVHANDCNTSMINVTISGNTSTGATGGGLFASSGVTSLTNVTISGNTSVRFGAGIYNTSDSTNLTLNNSIVAGNSSASGASDIYLGVTPGAPPRISGSNNLIGTGGSGGLVNGVNGNQVGVANPLLAPLGNYGGPTQTVALLPGSPAIDAGNTSLAIGTTDQRGKPYVGTVDIGAFESQGFTLTPVAGSTPQSTIQRTAFANPLAVTVAANNPIEPVNGGVVTYTVPGSGPSATLAGNQATIASGTASVTATANSTLGNYNVTATATGVATTASFALSNDETSSLVVNTTSDIVDPFDRKTSLREAIIYANTFTSSPPTITFDATVFGSAQVITLTGSQLSLSDTSEPITITAPTAGLTISGNNTSRVFEVFKNATANLNGLTITAGNAGTKGSGGGIYDYEGTVNLTNCTVTGNTAQYGGGIIVYGAGSAATLTNSTVSNNTAYWGGGAYASYGGSLTLVNCTVSTNSATDGGGIAAYHGSSLTVTNCTVSGNSGSRYGAGITVVNNSHGTLTNVTVSGNTAATGGGSGLYVLNSSTVTLNNTIVAGNTNGDIAVNQASTLSGSNNLIGTGSSGGLVNGTNGNIVGVSNPLLAPLGNYGGPTQTIALLPGSPAIDAGSNALAIGTTDQRGNSYVGTVDIGAFESQGFTLATVTGSTPQTTSQGTAFANPLAVTVTAKNAIEPVNGGIVTFTPPSSGPTATLSSTTAVIAGGKASVTATANSALGTYTVSASASGATSLTFSLKNVEAHSLIVNTTSDVVNPTDGLTSLREAIAYANTFTSSAPTITFDSTAFATPQTITLSGSQLVLTDTVEPIAINAPVAGVSISGNSKSRVLKIATGVTANLNGLTITAGSAGDGLNSYGGGVEVLGTATLTGCTVSGNFAKYGGGVYASDSGSVTLTNSSLTNNRANFNGGAVYVQHNGAARLTHCTVSGNSADSGGGLYGKSQSTLTVTDTTVSGNTADGAGGGVASLGTLSMTNSTVSNNTSLNFSGGILAEGVSTLTNVTVNGNSAKNRGGVDFVNGTQTLTNVTITGNSASQNDGGIYSGPGEHLTLNNSIVAGNTDSTGARDIDGPSNVSGSNNLIGTGGSGGLVNGTNGNIVGVANPLLTPLGNYGGPTQTIALLPGSPAIDAGSNALAIGTTDQRGLSYVGTVDMGAFESQGFTLTPVVGSTPQTAVTGNSFANPLGVTVTAKNTVEPVNGGLINFTVPLSGPSATLSSPSSTIASGQASVTATANTIVGGFNAAASATGATTATFSLNNIAPLSLSGLGGTVIYVQGSSPIQVAPALVVNQNLGLNIVNATVVFTNLQVGDRIDFNNPFALQRSLVLSPDGTTATLTFTGVSSAANYQATLRTVVFSCVAASPSTAPRTATFIVTDALTNTATGSQTINVTLTNQPPLLSGIETTPLTYLANYPTYPPQVVTNSLWIFDADSNNLTRAKVQITSGYQNNSNSHDLLSFTPQFGLTSSFNSMTGTLTLTGSASVTNYRIALRSVTFSSSGPAANGTPRTISFTAYDDSTPTPLASNTVSRNVNMQLTVAPPTLSGLNGTTTFTRGGSPVPIASTIGVNQPLGLDLGDATVKLTNLQPGDRFEFHNQFALQRSLVYSPDETSATLTLSGFATPAQYQTTLQSIIFWNVAGNLFTAPRAATFVVTDAAGQPSAPGVQYFTVAPSNQPPVLSGIEQTPLVYQANHPEFPPQRVTSTLLVTDPDSNNLTSATVKITSGYQNNTGGHDVLSFVNQSGISGLFNAAMGTLTLSGLSSVSNYGVALRSVTFSTSGTNVAPGTRIVTFTAFDDTTPTPQASNQMSRSVLVTTTNASPVLSGLTPVSLYVQGAPPLLFASSLQVADVDSPVLNGATISFTNWQVGDRLSFFNQFALQHTFTEDLVAHTASLTITGPTSIANYQTMLRSIGFYNVAGIPSVATRNVSIIVNDGFSNSNTVTGSINLRRV